MRTIRVIRSVKYNSREQLANKSNFRLFFLLTVCGRPEVVSKMARIDKEKLAFEVEKYVFLYDKSHAKYKSRNATDQAWAAVASELGIEGNSID